MVNESNAYHDEASDESNFEDFDDESPLIVHNVDEKFGYHSPNLAKNSDVKSASPSVGLDGDNRRLFR